MQSSIIPRYEELLGNLIHDLRQPLGNIETGAYLLNLVTPPDQTGSREQLLAIERQVSQAARLLSEASAALARLRAQRVESECVTAESFDLTKPVTAGVT
jgi:signal transduction histidine kinase